jgi:hypothetical protein
MTSSRATPLTKTLIAITFLAGGLTGPSDINTGLKSWGIPPDPSELTLSAEQSAKIFKSVGAGFERLGTRAIAANHLSQAFAPTPASNPNVGNRNGWF